MGMKKIYMLAGSVLLILLLFPVSSFAQEMLIGGNMENPDDWATSPLNMDAGNTVEFEFYYTDEIPSTGSDGCLRVTGTNTGTSGGNLTNFMFYQQVTLQRGVAYTFNCAYKDKRTNNYWFEVWVGGIEPAEGADYRTNEGATFIGGYKSSNWAPECTMDVFNGNFLGTACSPDGHNPLILAGTGDTTLFFGLKMGIWDDQSSNFTFETLVDNVSLMGPVSAVKNYSGTGNMTLYPNPASGQVHITGIESDNLRIYNLTGQEVLQFRVTKRNMDFDLSGLETGLYFLRSGDSTAKLLIE
jgi:hypothetical protein